MEANQGRRFIMGYLANGLLINNMTADRSPEAAFAMDYIGKLQRELFYLWVFIGQEGAWDEAREFVDEHTMVPTPFEYGTRAGWYAKERE